MRSTIADVTLCMTVLMYAQRHLHH